MRSVYEWQVSFKKYSDKCGHCTKWNIIMLILTCCLCQIPLYSAFFPKCKYIKFAIWKLFALKHTSLIYVKETREIFKLKCIFQNNLSAERFNPDLALIFTCLQYKSFENTAGKGEITYNKLFLLFAQCFLPVLITFCHFKEIKKCRLQTLFARI